MKRLILFALLLSVYSTALGQCPPGGGLPPDPGGGGGTTPPGGTLPPPPITFTPLVLPTQIGNPVVEPGGPNGGLVLTNRAHLVSTPVELELLHVDVTVSLPTAVLVDVVYRDYIDIWLNVTMPGGLNPNRSWNVIQPGTIVVRIFQGNLNVYYINSNGEETLISSTPINTADGTLPVDLSIDEDEGSLVINYVIPPGLPGSVIVVLPPNLNPVGSVVIHNREPVAGVTFVGEIIDLHVEGTPFVP